MVVKQISKVYTIIVHLLGSSKKVMANLEDIEKKAANLMGLSQQSIGKTQARKEFFPLVDSLGENSSTIEITDHNKPVAVLLSYHHYIALTSKLCMLSKEQDQEKDNGPNLTGSIKIKSKSLEESSKKVADKFKKSLKESSKQL